MDERCKSQTVWPAWSLPISVNACKNMLGFFSLWSFFQGFYYCACFASIYNNRKPVKISPWSLKLAARACLYKGLYPNQAFILGFMTQHSSCSLPAIPDFFLHSDLTSTKNKVFDASDQNFLLQLHPSVSCGQSKAAKQYVKGFITSCPATVLINQFLPF